MDGLLDGEGSYSLDCQYDRKGRLKEVILPDDSSISYVYDALFGREAIRLAADGSEVYKHTYTTYDTTGRIHEETLIGYSGNRFIIGGLPLQPAVMKMYLNYN